MIWQHASEPPKNGVVRKGRALQTTEHILYHRSLGRETGGLELDDRAMAVRPP